MKLTPVGIDIAKRVFQVHYVDAETGEIVNRQIKRAKFLEHFVNRAPCLIGMEACGGSQHWARQLTKLGHEVKLMPAGFVKAFNIRNKSDAADARAIWLAVQQPGKAVAVKSEAQQAVLALHRMRQQLVKFRTMQINSLRGLLAEYGEVMGKGRAALDKAIPAVLAGITDRLPMVLIDTLREQARFKAALHIGRHLECQAIMVPPFFLCGIHDSKHPIWGELFQGSQPVLAGIDVASTYCYLLAPEAHRDGDTWAIHLLDLQAQGLDPEHTIADAGTGLRAGQKMAWPDTPCHGDVFHIIQHGKSLATLWHRVASGARTGREQLEARLANPRRRGEDSLLEAALETLRRNEAHAHELAADLRTLVQWLERDILSLAGPDLATRQRLFDFVVAELQQREARDLSRTGAYRRALQNQRDGLLAFAGLLDTKLDAIARTHNVARHLVREVCMLHRKSETSSAFWQGWNRLLARIGRPFHGVYAAVSGALHSTPRSSSLVENLNSRLRVYLTNRRHLKGGRAWLGLLQFVFNHRRFARSRCPERTGKSPRELMSRKPHDHWLTLLGFGPLQPQRT